MLTSESGAGVGNWRLDSIAASSVGDAYQRLRKVFADSSEYEGTFANGVPHTTHGQPGRYVWADGSSYRGTFANGQRHGVGHYVWASGASYQGEWRENHMHGVGTMEAAPPPPATGVTPPAGKRITSRYQGGWWRGIKQGLGKQVFINGDIFEGLWRGGLPHGPGRYRFACGSEYDGAWLAGRMHGTGTFVWASGERYEGQWKMSLPDGLGVLTLRDGSVFDGQWLEGVRHGVCIARFTAAPKPTSRRSVDLLPGMSPALSSVGANLFNRRSSLRDANNNHAAASKAGLPASGSLLRVEGVGGGGGGGGSPSSNRSFTATNTTRPVMLASISLGPRSSMGDGDSSNLPSPGATELTSGGGGASTPGPLAPGQVAPPTSLLQAVEAVSNASFGSATAGAQPYAFVREYEHGRVVREWPLARDEAESVLAAFSSSKVESPIGKLLRRSTTSTSLSEKRLGETLSKGHHAHNVMVALQLGIRFSVSTAATEELPRELKPSDYKHKVKQWFPRQGSYMTPIHASEDFMWKDYAPKAFRKLRELFDVDTGTYLDSLCSDAALRLLNSPGKSGSVFFLTHDDQFFVKTLKKGEVRLLYEMLPAYHRHMAVHPHTLLTKFYGLHAIKGANNRKVYVVVMGNLFNTPVQLHAKYDLKGSTLGRTAGVTSDQDPHAILKDLDLKTSFRLESSWLERLQFQVKSDCALLQSCSIMDYSLLLGVSYPSRQGATEPAQPPRRNATRPSNFSETAPEQAYNLQFPKLVERLARSKLADEARERLVSLARARLVDNPGAKAAARRSQAMDYYQSSSMPTTGSAHMDAHVGQDHVADQMALQLGLSRSQLGVNMPAMAIPLDPSSGQRPEECVVFFGIIDVLQNYNKSKQLEHGLKSLVHDSHSISVTNPNSYAQRFTSFMKSVFV